MGRQSHSELLEDHLLHKVSTSPIAFKIMNGTWLGTILRFFDSLTELMREAMKPLGGILLKPEENGLYTQQRYLTPRH